MIEILKSVINTLNGVEVKGAENLDRLLGSIRALESVVSQETSKNLTNKDVKIDG